MSTVEVFIFLALLFLVKEAKTEENEQYLLFMKSPTTMSPAGNCTFSQRDSNSFTSRCLNSSLFALGLTNSTIRSSKLNLTVGFTYQFELLDCFLSPHDCDSGETERSIRAFLNACEELKVPCGITLDPYQFWYESNLWNWFDPENSRLRSEKYRKCRMDKLFQHECYKYLGTCKNNNNNKNSRTTSNKKQWRNWGSQFRMPTPQPNIASPQLLEKVAKGIEDAVNAVKSWYETSKYRDLLVSLKIAEELDVGANFYYYPEGNSYRTKSTDNDPKYGPDWSQGLSGGLEPMGFNMLRTLKLRVDGGPPTRDEIKIGVQHYFNTSLQAALKVWPELIDLDILFTHGGLCGDHLIPWASAMVDPSSPAYSFYLSKSKSPLDGNAELIQRLTSYDPTRKRFAVGEYFCTDCARNSTQDWLDSLNNVFLVHNETFFVRFVSVYNLTPFASSSGALNALHQFLSL